VYPGVNGKSNDDALAWATRLRNKNIAPAPVDGYYPALALVGGAPAGAILQKLFESKDAKVRAAAAETCRHGIFGDSTVASLAKLARDPSIQVRQSTIRALAMYANWRYEAAQKALIQLATDKSAGAVDRLNATDAIGYAVRLQVRGVRQDPPMFQALVSLLQEKDEPVRSTAAGILAPLYEPSGEGAKRRRSPEGCWEKWLDEITARQMGALKNYETCGKAGQSSPEAVTLFCKGGPHAIDLPSAFQHTLKAAELGSVAAQSAVAIDVCQWQRRTAELCRSRQVVDQSGRGR